MTPLNSENNYSNPENNETNIETDIISLEIDDEDVKLPSGISLKRRKYYSEESQIFEPGELIHRFPQGEVAHTYKYGPSLYTGGLGPCTAALIKNIDKTGKTYLAHLEPEMCQYTLHSLQEIAPRGTYAILISGTMSHPLEKAEQIFKELGIKVRAKIKIDTGGLYWNIAYCSQKDEIIVDRRSAKELLILKGL